MNYPFIGIAGGLNYKKKILKEICGKTGSGPQSIIRDFWTATQITSATRPQTLNISYLCRPDILALKHFQHHI